jgi:non-specific serine/threonine protein kinase
MPDSPNKLSQFWQELKRRKVIRVVIVYAAAGYGIIQFVELVTDPLNLPEWALALVIVLVATGFPIAIIFAWIFDITTKGIKKTEPLEDTAEENEVHSDTNRHDFPEKSIIVLPFENISSDPDQEYFSDGLTEEIITDLSHIHELLVISRSSAMTFKGAKKKTKEIASEVNVKYVLEGSVRKVGNNLRITAQLIDAESDAHIWAEKYRGTLDDVFDIQETVSRSIADVMQLKLTPHENIKIAEHPINNVQAYEVHLRARYKMMLFTEESLGQAIQLIKNGLNIIGENEIFYADLGLAYLCLYEVISKKDKDCFNIAEECVKKIFTLNPESSKGHLLKGNIYLRQGDVQMAATEFRKALEIDPNELDSLLRLGWIYNLSGKGDAGRSLFRRGLELDPLTPINHMILGSLELLEGRRSLGLKHIIRAHEIEPENPIFRYWYAMGLAYDHRYEEAYKLFNLIEKETSTTIFSKLGTFIKYALQGEKEGALQSVTEDLKSLAKEDEMYPIWMAEGYSLIGEKGDAIDWLEHGINYGFIHYLWLSEKDPFLEKIRGEERFIKLMKKVKHLQDEFEI